MTDFGRWIDAHSHLADPRWDAELPQALNDAVEKGVGFFLQGGVGPEDWSRQIELKKKYPDRIGLCFGLHPYWVAANDEDLCEIAIDQLTQVIHKAMALGEIGLDFRPHIMKDSRERQIEFFQLQLELAQAAEMPVVFHLVQAHEDALKTLDLWGIPPKGGLVHSFNGSAQKAQDLTQRGLYLSVGGPVVRPDNEKLHQAVKQMPLERLLIETDSPDQPPPEFSGVKNPPASLWAVAQKIAELKRMTPTEILDITSSNFRRLFGV